MIDCIIVIAELIVDLEILKGMYVPAIKDVFAPIQGEGGGGSQKMTFVYPRN